MKTTRLLLLEPDASRASSLAQVFEALRMPVRAVDSIDELARVAAADGPSVVAVSGIGGDGAARVRAVRQDPRTAQLSIVALASSGAAGLSALRSGADEALRWPASGELIRARFRTVLNAARSSEEAKQTAWAFARLLEAFEAREPHRIEHSSRVGRLAADLAKRAGLSAPEVERVRIGGVLHDIGTIAIPDEILYKREPLTAAELAVVKSHPVIGFSLLRGVPALEQYLPFVFRHHERVDGSGYPDGLSGSELPLQVQLVSLADAYDAMTSSRPYRDVRDGRQTLVVLEEEMQRGRWDPAILRLLAASIATERDPRAG